MLSRCMSSWLTAAPSSSAPKQCMIQGRWRRLPFGREEIPFACFHANGTEREDAAPPADEASGEEAAESRKEFFLYFSSAGDFSLQIKGERRFYRMVMWGLLKTVVPDVHLFLFIFFFLLRLVAEQVLHHLMPLLFSNHLARSLSPSLTPSLALTASPALGSRFVFPLPKLAFCFAPEPRIENGRHRSRESTPPVVKARAGKGVVGPPLWRRSFHPPALLWAYRKS